MAPNRYSQIIEKVFLARHRTGADRVPFLRRDIERAARQLGLQLPKNIGDLLYSFRFRSELPDYMNDGDLDLGSAYVGDRPAHFP